MTPEALFAAVQQQRYVARRILRNEFDVDDALQNAVIKVVRSYQHFRNDAQLATWIHVIVRNEALMIVRKQKPYELLDAVPLSKLPTAKPIDDQLAEQRRAEALCDAIQQLPSRLRCAAASWLVGDTVSEAAELRGKSQGGEKSARHHAKLRLQAALSGVV